MQLQHLAALGAYTVLLAFAQADARAQQVAAAASVAPQLLPAQGGQLRVVTVATGLEHPWSLAFLPDGRSLLVAERPGRLRIIRDGLLDPSPVWIAPPDGSDSNDRLKWIALHPRFAENGLVYLSYPRRSERGTTLAIGRGRLDGARLVDVEEIFVADAWESSGNLGGKILFGPDETLYVTIGDRDPLCCNGSNDNSLRLKAQELTNHVGKTLRLNDDGGVPADNPFVGRADAKPEIFTYGHRNGYGLAFHPTTGELWQTDIGPLGGDEVNVLLPGHNYGWPLVSMGRDYTGTLVSDQPFRRNGMDDPRVFWVPSISPSSLMFYTGDKFPQWRDDLFVGALNARHLQRVAFNSESQAVRYEPLLYALNRRIRDVQQSPDGLLYLATELTSAVTSSGDVADGNVLRLEPVERLPSTAASAQR